MALPQARPPWLDTTMPRTPTATACGAAQGRTKMDGKRMEKKVVMVCFHLQSSPFSSCSPFSSSSFSSKVCFLLVLHLHLDKKNMKNTHHNTCLATAGFWRSWEGASLGDITTWLWRPLRCIFNLTFGKMDGSHFYHIRLINKKRSIFHLKTNLKKTATMQSCPPRWCFVQSSPAVHPQHFECLSGRQVHLPHWHRRFCQGFLRCDLSQDVVLWGRGRHWRKVFLPSNDFNETIL